jgi:hypothetical protein
VLSEQQAQILKDIQTEITDSQLSSVNHTSACDIRNTQGVKSIKSPSLYYSVPFFGIERPINFTLGEDRCEGFVHFTQLRSPVSRLSSFMKYHHVKEGTVRTWLQLSIITDPRNGRKANPMFVGSSSTYVHMLSMRLSYAYSVDILMHWCDVVENNLGFQGDACINRTFLPFFVFLIPLFFFFFFHACNNVMSTAVDNFYVRVLNGLDVYLQPLGSITRKHLEFAKQVLNEMDLVLILEHFTQTGAELLNFKVTTGIHLCMR